MKKSSLYQNDLDRHLFTVGISLAGILAGLAGWWLLLRRKKARVKGWWW